MGFVRVGGETEMISDSKVWNGNGSALLNHLKRGPEGTLKSHFNPVP